MPKQSDRQRLLADIASIIALEILEEDDEDLLPCDAWVFGEDDVGMDRSVDGLFELLLVVEANRYVHQRHLYAKSKNFRLNYFFCLPEKSFLQLTRTSKPGFDFILSEIDKHTIFRNASRKPQAPVWLQLAITLDRIGNYGSDVSLERTLKLWGVGKGAVALYTFRVLTALNAVAKKFIAWPRKLQRRKMSRRMALKGFKGCVDFIDGTTFPLSQKPAVDGECYFDRKQRYSVNAQVVCNDRRRIIAFYAGWPRSCSDSTVCREMLLSKTSYKPYFFCPGQYVIGDSAYPADKVHNILVPAYRSNMKGLDNEAFDACLAHVRVVNEHTIGVLKARWASLKELRVQIKCAEDMKRILMWTVACVTLHNMLINIGYL